SARPISLLPGLPPSPIYWTRRRSSRQRLSAPSTMSGRSWAAAPSARAADGSAARSRNRLHLRQDRVDGKAFVVLRQPADDSVGVNAERLFMLGRRLLATRRKEGEAYAVDRALGEQRRQSGHGRLGLGRVGENGTDIRETFDIRAIEHRGIEQPVARMQVIQQRERVGRREQRSLREVQLEFPGQAEMGGAVQPWPVETGVSSQLGGHLAIRGVADEEAIAQAVLRFPGAQGPGKVD